MLRLLYKSRKHYRTRANITYNPIQYDGISFAKLRYNWLRVLMRPDLGPNTFGTFVGLVSGRLQATATKLIWAIQAVALCRYALQFWMHTSEPLNTCWCTVTSAATTCLRSFVDIFVNSKADHPKHTNICIKNNMKNILVWCGLFALEFSHSY